MNEKGLVVEVLWLEGTVYPPEDERLGLDSVQWVQYQLDTAAAVDEVIASLDRVRVEGTVEIRFTGSTTNRGGYTLHRRFERER